MITKLFDNHPLFKECLDALGVNLLDQEESDQLSLLFKQLYPITPWGKIDWDKIDKKINIGDQPEQIISSLTKLLQQQIDVSAYIEWSNAGIPVIKSNLHNIIKCFDDVTCVAFEKFIFNPTVGYIIEILPNYNITVGIINKKNSDFNNEKIKLFFVSF